MNTKRPAPLVAAAARFSLPLAIAAWFILLWASATTPMHDEDAGSLLPQLVVLLLAFGSASSALHVVLRGERHWSYLIGFGLSAGLLGFWFVMLVVTRGPAL